MLYLYMLYLYMLYLYTHKGELNMCYAVCGIVGNNRKMTDILNWLLDETESSWRTIETPIDNKNKYYAHITSAYDTYWRGKRVAIGLMEEEWFYVCMISMISIEFSSKNDAILFKTVFV